MILITGVEVKDPEGQVILDAIATRFGYTGFVEPKVAFGEPAISDEDKTPQTKQEFLQAWFLQQVLGEVSQHLTATAGTVAAKDKQAEIDATIKPELEVIKKKP